MSRLERRCRRVALAYPDQVRRAEVLTTLMESNAGRRAPRVVDAVDVLRHGVAARLRRPAQPGSRLGRFGDLLAVAVVAGIVAHAVTAVAVMSLALPNHGVAYNGWWMFQSNYEVVAGGVLTVVALGTAWVACRGKVVHARVLVVAAATAGLGFYAVERMLGERWSFTTFSGQRVVAAGIAVLVPALCTHAVARSARVVPASWWATVFVAALLVGRYVVGLADPIFGWGRASLTLSLYLAVLGVIGVLVLPLVLVRRPVATAD